MPALFIVFVDVVEYTFEPIFLIVIIKIYILSEPLVQIMSKLHNIVRKCSSTY